MTMTRTLTDVVREWEHDVDDLDLKGVQLAEAVHRPDCRLCAVKQWMQDILRAPECSVADALGVEDGDE